MIDLKIDKKLLVEQKRVLLETIWDVEEQDELYKLWGIVELIDYIQDTMDGVELT